MMQSLCSFLWFFGGKICIHIQAFMKVYFVEKMLFTFLPFTVLKFKKAVLKVLWKLGGENCSNVVC